MGKKPKPIEVCSCDESAHLRKALKKIMWYATEVTEHDGDPVGDLVQIGNLAQQGLDLEKLVGEPNP